MVEYRNLMVLRQRNSLLKAMHLYVRQHRNFYRSTADILALDT